MNCQQAKLCESCGGKFGCSCSGGVGNCFEYKDDNGTIKAYCYKCLNNRSAGSSRLNEVQKPKSWSDVTVTISSASINKDK